MNKTILTSSAATLLLAGQAAFSAVEPTTADPISGDDGKGQATTTYNMSSVEIKARLLANNYANKAALLGVVN